MQLKIGKVDFSDKFTHYSPFKHLKTFFYTAVCHHRGVRVKTLVISFYYLLVCVGYFLEHTALVSFAIRIVRLRCRQLAALLSTSPSHIKLAIKYIVGQVSHSKT